jgi:hypothetical protein
MILLFCLEVLFTPVSRATCLLVPSLTKHCGAIGYYSDQTMSNLFSSSLLAQGKYCYVRMSSSTVGSLGRNSYVMTSGWRWLPA